MPTANLMKNALGAYKTALIEGPSKPAFTNTVPISAYRGAGRPEGNYVMERLVETAAAEMGIDRAELRRRNHIHPPEMPYKTPAATIYDSGDLSSFLDPPLAIPRSRRF